MKGIVISGYYGFGNSGDDALLLSIISELKKHGLKDSITVLSSNPEETKKIYGVKAVNRINPFAVLYSILFCRMFISGGGTLIQDGTSTKSLLYYLYLIKLAKLLGKKVMLYANGIGPVNKESNKIKCNKILNTVDVITVRDEKSMDVLEDMSISKPLIQLTADPVFLLDKAQNIDNIIKEIGSEKYFCISVRNTKKLGADFEKNLANAVENISIKYNLTPVFVPLQKSDIKICADTIKHLKTASVILSHTLSPTEIMAVVSKAQMAVGMRLHMLIYAAAAAIPIVGIVYDPKVSGFMEYAHQNLYVNDYDANENNLYELFEACISNADEIKDELVKIREELILKSNENAEIAAKLYKGM